LTNDSESEDRASEQSWGLPVRESERRGMAPEALADELVRHELGAPEEDFDRALSELAALRERLPKIDGLALARAARDELERRVA
jgi:hypothetical protein